jgi:hypothetical protein
MAIIFAYFLFMVDAQNKVAHGWRWAGGRRQQYQNIVGTTLRDAAQSYDIVAACCRLRAALFCASTISVIAFCVLANSLFDC